MPSQTIDSMGSGFRKARQGVHEPSAGTARLIARALEVPLAHLYCEDEETAALLLALHKQPPEVQEEATERLIAEPSQAGSPKPCWWATDDRACSTTPMNWTSPINMRDTQKPPRKRKRQKTLPTTKKIS